MADSSDRGAAAVEFAIIVPVLLAMVLGIVAFGHAYFVQSVLNGAARDAVRVMALENDPAAAANTAISSANSAIQLDAAQIVVTPDTCTDPGPSGPDTAQVTITFPVKLLGLGNDITLTGKGTMRCNG